MVGGELKEMYLCVGEALPGVEGQRDCRREGGLAVRAACEDNVYAPVPLDLDSGRPDLAPDRPHGRGSEAVAEVGWRRRGAESMKLLICIKF